MSKATVNLHILGRSLSLLSWSWALHKSWFLTNHDLWTWFLQLKVSIRKFVLWIPEINGSCFSESKHFFLWSEKNDTFICMLPLCSYYPTPTAFLISEIHLVHVFFPVLVYVVLLLRLRLYEKSRGRMLPPSVIKDWLIQRYQAAYLKKKK